MSETLRGTVKWFNDAKGFGFIEHESGRDVFVHYSVIQSDGFKTLKDGEMVEYEIKEGPKGLHAMKVVRTSAPASEGEAAAATDASGKADSGSSSNADDNSDEENLPGSAVSIETVVETVETAEYEHSAG